MSDSPLIAILGAAGVDTVGKLLDFLADVHDYSGNLIGFLAKVGEQNAHASLSLAQADTSHATADGYRELVAVIDNADDAVDDPDQH